MIYDENFARVQTFIFTRGQLTLIYCREKILWQRKLVVFTEDDILGSATQTFLTFGGIPLIKAVDDSPRLKNLQNIKFRKNFIRPRICASSWNLHLLRAYKHWIYVSTIYVSFQWDFTIHTSRWIDSPVFRAALTMKRGRTMNARGSRAPGFTMPTTLLLPPFDGCTIPRSVRGDASRRIFPGAECNSALIYLEQRIICAATWIHRSYLFLPPPAPRT